MPRFTRSLRAGLGTLAALGAVGGGMLVAGAAGGQDDAARGGGGGLGGTASTADVRPVGATASGDGTDQIFARVRFSERNGRLSASGFGVNFRPGEAYLSLIYNAGSVATGANACLPSAAGTQIPFGSMVVGEWGPVGSPIRTLQGVTLVGDAFVPLSNVGTTSIRRVDPTNPPTVTFNLQSCGALRR